MQYLIDKKKKLWCNSRSPSSNAFSRIQLRVAANFSSPQILPKDKTATGLKPLLGFYTDKNMHCASISCNQSRLGNFVSVSGNRRRQLELQRLTGLH